MLKALQEQEQHYALFSKSFLDELNSLSRSEIQIIASSNTRKAFRLMLLNPRHQAHHREIQDILLTMHRDEAGQKVLHGHRIPGWSGISDAELSRMTQLLQPKP